MKTIESSARTAPPAWAVLERQLMRAIDEAAPVYLDKYTRPGGSLIWREDYPGDGVWADDLYEAFFNWPIYYALGGSAYTGQRPSSSGVRSRGRSPTTTAGPVASLSTTTTGSTTVKTTSTSITSGS